MRHRSSWSRLVGCLSAGILLAPSVATACGGFFCNAVNPVPIVQAGERVVFIKHGSFTTMHIEVAYAGQPTSFSWMLPLPHVPLDTDGKPLPLDKALRLSHPRIFDQLQADTAPSFRVNNTFKGSQCMFASAAGGTGGGPVLQDSASSPSNQSKGVTVLQEANVGPYAAIIIKATNADDLYTWLKENQYQQDPVAKPILKTYIEKDFVFLGLKLQNGKAAGDLRPVALTLGEDAPCVPLRLTSIAATADMPILVFVLGPGRAVPKNNLHVLVNPKALTWPGAGNYQQVLSDAVDQAAGHAFVTEYAGPTDSLAGDFANVAAPGFAKAAAQLESATTLGAVIDAYGALGLPADATWQSLLQATVTKPADLKGYPYGNCYYAPGGGGFGSDASGGAPTPGCEPNDTHVTTDAEFYNYLSVWLDQKLAITADLAKLKQRIQDEVLAPLKEMEGFVAQTRTVTRFYTTIDPEEMTKDPIFAFNAALPDVKKDHVLTTVTHMDTGNSCGFSHVVATYEDGSTHVFDCQQFSCPPTLGPVAGVSPMLGAEVLDEQGGPTPIAKSDISKVDALLTLAEAGKKSLPEGTTLEPVPPYVPSTTGNTAKLDGSSGGSTGCSVAPTARPSAGLLGLLLGLAVVLRRRGLRS